MFWTLVVIVCSIDCPSIDYCCRFLLFFHWQKLHCHITPISSRFRLHLWFIRCPRNVRPINWHFTLAFNFTRSLCVCFTNYITCLCNCYFSGQDVPHSIIKQQFNEWISISSFLYIATRVSHRRNGGKKRSNGRRKKERNVQQRHRRVHRSSWRLQDRRLVCESFWPVWLCARWKTCSARWYKSIIIYFNVPTANENKTMRAPRRKILFLSIHGLNLDIENDRWSEIFFFFLFSSLIARSGQFLWNSWLLPLSTDNFSR